MITIKRNIKVNVDRPAVMQGAPVRVRLEHKMDRTSRTLTKKVKNLLNIPAHNNLESRVGFTNMQAFIYNELMALVEENMENCPILDPYAIDNKEINVRAEFIMEIGNWYAQKCVCTFVLRDTNNKHVLTRKVEAMLLCQTGSYYVIVDVNGATHKYDNPYDVLMSGLSAGSMFSCYTAQKRFIRIHYAYLEETRYIRIRFAGLKPNTDIEDDNDDEEYEDDDTDDT